MIISLHFGGKSMEAISIRDLTGKYDQELVRLNYKKGTIKNYRIFWRQLVRYFDSKNELIFSEETALQFLDDRYNLTENLRKRPLTRNESSVQQMVRKLVHFWMHGTIGRPNRVPRRSIETDEFAEILGRYADFCFRYGYATSTRRNMRYYAVKFFIFLESNSIPHVSEIIPQIIINYVNSLTVYSYKSVGLCLTCLRSLLDFLHTNGYNHQNLSEAVPRQQARNGCAVPSTWSYDDVLNLVKAIDRGNPCGKRDYAIILLVTRLGVRASDVRNLKLENLKWDTKRIELVQSKTGQNVSLPLLKDVGWAIIDYLKHGRPSSDSPYVFLSHLAPYKRLGYGNSFYHIITRCMRIAQITASFQQKVGMHSLRHTLASTLLEKHTPLPTIAGILGHESVESTAIYLKTDVVALRECALDSPGGVK
jgi:integrase/recombinase XerD